MPTLFDAQVPENKPELDEGWLYEFTEAFFRGIDLAVRPDVLNKSNLLEADNIRIEKARLIKDFGYKDFASTVRGRPRVEYQFFLKNGSSQLVLITNATFYVWNSSADAWHYVSDGTDTTVNATEAAGQTEITVADISGFADGDYVGIILDDGTQHQTTVNGTPVATEITITDALPSQTTAGKAFVKAIDLSGSDDKAISVATWALTDKLYFTNGVDTPQQYDGSSLSDIQNLPGTTFTCHVISVFNNYLELMNTIEDGTAFPQRVRWCETADPTDWNELVNYRDLYESEDFIIGSESLGPFNIIYKERSLVRQEYIGTAELTFRFIPTINGEGLIAHDCVVNLDAEHIFMGNANIYRYRGGFDLEAVGDEIYDLIFGNDGELNPGYTARSFALYIEETDEILFFYPSGSDTYPRRAARFKLSREAWTTRTYPIDILGYGFFQAQGDLTWQTAAGAWTAYALPWNSKQVQANSPVVHLCVADGSTYSVMEIDYIADDDDGTDIEYSIITKDFYVPNRELRFNRFDFRLAADSVTVEYSTDAGDSYISLGTLTPGAIHVTMSLYKQFVGRRVRFRLTGSGYIEFEALGFTYKRESLHTV